MFLTPSLPRSRVGSYLLILTLWLSMLCLSSAAHAATLAVPQQYPTIQDAVNAAVDGDTVLVADGTYSGPGNVDVDFGGKNITVTSINGPNATIIDCGGFASTDGSGNHRGFYLHSGETNATISGFTVKNGYEAYIKGVSDSGFGGGIFTANTGNGTVTISNCIISGNTALSEGGGVYNYNSHGSITLTNCTISTNNGGGIYNNNNYGTSIGNITLTNCTITANSGGSGIFNSNSNGIITLVNCIINTNTASSGSGGIYNSNNTGTIEITNCTISANNGARGGGVFNLNASSGTIAMNNCALNANTANSGGGVYNGNINGGTIMLTNCIITANTASGGYGGGVEYDNYSGTGTLTNCTITANIASSGGGIENDNSSSTVTAINNIIYGDTGGEVGGGGITATYCDIQGGWTGTGNINADPQFVRNLNIAATPPDYGDTHLQPGSPCLGAGTASGAPATDFDGVTRPNPPSIGAYDAHLSPLYVSPSGSDSNPGTIALPKLTIQAAINATGNTVIVKDGTYTGPGNVDLDFGGRSNLTVTSQNGAATTIIDCGGSYGTDHRGFYFHSNETNAVVNGLTIKNGYENAYGVGSPVYNSLGSNGGAVYVALGSTLTLTNCMLLGNTAFGFSEAGGDFGDGGGIENDGTLTLTNCILSGNTAPSGGGGIYNNGGTLTLTNSTLSGNSTDYGGYGGGIENDGTATLTNSTLSGNMAEYGGGTYNGGTLMLTNGVLSGNTATYGGGIYNAGFDGYDGTATLTNSTLSGNMAGDGGGIENDGMFTLTNCTLSGNEVYFDGGLGGSIDNGFFNTGASFTLINDILYGDTSNTGEIVNGGGEAGSGAIVSVSYSDVQGGYSGMGNINADPLFVRSPNPTATPPDYGDLHLRGGSPCLGAGTASGAPTTTLDGFTRPNPPSIGAYEATSISLPAAPTNLQAVAGNAQVTLTWTAPTGPVTSYTLYRGTSASSLTALKSGITATTFTNISLTNGTTYYYAVAAVNSAGTGPKSSTVSAMPLAPPAAPTHLQAVVGNAQIALTWVAPTGTVTSYTLYRGTTSTSLAVIKTGITTTNFTNASLTNGTTYYYAVAAVNASGTGAKSATVSATPTGTTLPAAPMGLTATAGNAQITLTWTAPSGTVTSYTLYRGTSAANLTVLKTGITATTFTNVSLKNGTIYYYAVAAVNSAGTSAQSSIVSATPSAPLAAPTHLQVVIGNLQATLSWTAPAGTVTSYTLYRGTSATSLTVLKTGITTTSFTNVSLKHGTTYYYTVSAVNASGMGPSSNEVSATP